MLVYVVSIFDKKEHQIRNVWYYTNPEAALQRIEHEAKKVEGLVKMYDGSYEENPDDYEDGIIIDWCISPIRNSFEG